MNTMSGYKAQARSFLTCAAVITEPNFFNDIISPVMSPAICGSRATGSADNNERAAVRNVVSRDKDHVRAINTTGSPSPSAVPLFVTQDMVVTRIRSNQFQ